MQKLFSFNLWLISYTKVKKEIYNLNIKRVRKIFFYIYENLFKEIYS